MSRASMWVRFPNGEVRHGIYDGTTDLAYPPVYDTSEEAWAAYKSGEIYRRMDADASQPGEGESVVVACNYGYGFWWKATATRDFVTSMLDCDERGDAEAEHDGLPPA